MAQRSMQQYDPENWRTMDLLLMAGGKVNLGMKWSGTPLHIACNTGTTRMAELLLAAGADPDVQADTYATPLNLACRNIDLEIAIRMVEILLEYNIRDDHYGAPLHRVCRTRPRATTTCQNTLKRRRGCQLARQKRDFCIEDDKE